MTSVSDEARQRIDDARIRNAVFNIRHHRGGEKLSMEDAVLLARVVIEGLDNQAFFSKEYVKDRILQLGRSKLVAETLSNFLFS